MPPQQPDGLLDALGDLFDLGFHGSAPDDLEALE
jgi:hypothetical protein